MKKQNQLIKNRKEIKKIPSKFSGILNYQLSTISNISLNFINLSSCSFLKKICGRAENRTRNFQLTAECFTTKLLAHNTTNMNFSYLNFCKVIR